MDNILDCNGIIRWGIGYCLEFLGLSLVFKFTIVIFLAKSLVFWSNSVWGQDADTDYDPLLLFPDNNLISDLNENLPAIEVVKNLVLSEIDDYPYVIARSNFVNFGECTKELRNMWSEIAAEGEIFAYPFSISELRLYKETHLEIHYCNSNEMLVFADDNKLVPPLWQMNKLLIEGWKDDIELGELY